jgi:hypothetical protein
LSPPNRRTLATVSLNMSESDKLTPAVFSDAPPPNLPSPRRSTPRRLLARIKERKWTWLFASLTFAAGVVAEEGLKQVWEKFFPPKDRTGEVLAANRMVLEQVESSQAVLTTQIDSLPTSQEVRNFLREAVNSLVQNAGVLASMNEQLVRGEEVLKVPQPSGVPPLPSTPGLLFGGEATLPDSFMAYGVGSQWVTAARLAADMRPNLWIRMGEVRQIGDGPRTQLRLVEWHPGLRTVSVALNDRRWDFPLGSYMEFDSSRGQCRMSYAGIRGADLEDENRQFHGFELSCAGADPTIPGNETG